MKANSLTILYQSLKKYFLKTLFLFTLPNFLLLHIISFHGSKLQLCPNPISNSQFLIAAEGWNHGLYS